MFGWLGQRRNRRKTAAQLYKAVLEQARQPYFYAVRGVPDTLDGRFELVLLHAYLAWSRLKEQGPAGVAMGQALFDVMFADMDGALRNIGVGDLSVPRHVKRMMKAFHGRSRAYADPFALPEALRRNLYGTVASPKDDDLSWFGNYITDNIKVLSAQNVVDGLITFKEISHEQEGYKAPSGLGMAA